MKTKYRLVLTQKLEKSISSDQYQQARKLALRRLDARDYTRSELDEYLARKDIPAEVRDALLERLIEVGLIDDARYAQNFVSARHEIRHQGSWLIGKELERRGVAPDIIAECLAQISDTDELDSAMVFAKRKLSGWSRLTQVQVKRRLAGALARRGFSPDVVSGVLHRLTTDDEGYSLQEW